jgi:hypothetical protein
MDNIIGIDPGRKGCLWTLFKNGSTGRWIDMPFNSSGIGDYAIVDFITQYKKEDTIIILEKAFYSPIIRGNAGFQFGVYYGTLKGIIIGLGYKLEEVSPIVWKKYYGLISTKDKKITKDHSIKKAMELNPLFRTRFSYQRSLNKKDENDINNQHIQIVKKDGRAEAYLIAEYGRRHFA